MPDNEGSGWNSETLYRHFTALREADTQKYEERHQASLLAVKLAMTESEKEKIAMQRSMAIVIGVAGLMLTVVTIVFYFKH